MKRPYPIHIPRRDMPVTGRHRESEVELLQTLRLYLDTVVAFPAGRRVLEIGGPGLLAKLWLERNLSIVRMEPSTQAAHSLLRQHPGLQVRVGELREGLERSGVFEVVLCHGVLHRRENPAEALRHIAAICTEWLFLETPVCDAEQPVLAISGAAEAYPSPSYIAMALRRAGFPFVYAPAEAPQHPGFRVKWKGNLDWQRAGRPLRCIFVASKHELYLPSLLPLLMPEGDALYKLEPPRASPWDGEPWPDAGEPSEEEIAEACRALATLRPLVPYPGYKFDSDWDNPDLAFRMRRKIWTYCLEHGRDTAVELPWHLGLRIRLHLANDLSRQLFVAGCFDPNEFAFLDRSLEPGMTFVDAGANEGLYTLFAGRHVGESGRVLAFEPSAREFARMEANIALNGLGNVRPFRMALAQDDGEADLLIADDAHSGQNTLGALPHEGVVEAGRERVAVRRLDRALAEEGMDRVDFIKIDVEGAEAGLLEGASETLRRFRPLLLIEFNDGALRKQGRSSAELLKLLESTEYVVFSFQETTGLPGPPAEGIHEGNLLCVPREKGLPKQWALSLVRTVPA